MKTDKAPPNIRNVEIKQLKPKSDETNRKLNYIVTFQKKLCHLLHRKPFKNDEKCFLFHLKSSFHSQDI